jgi:hypothetical protein
LHQPFVFLDVEQHGLRPVAEQDDESSGVLVAKPFEKAAEAASGVTGCHYFVEGELIHRLFSFGRKPWTPTA